MADSVQNGGLPQETQHFNPTAPTHAPSQPIAEGEVTKPSNIDPKNANFDLEAYLGSEVASLLTKYRPPLRAMTWEYLTVRDEKTTAEDYMSPEGPPTTATVFLGPLADKMGLAPKAPKNVGDPSRYRGAAISECSGYMLPGQTTLLIGPPGSGKTTLMRTLAGLDAGQRGVVDGDILVNGKLLPKEKAGRVCSYVHQLDTMLAPVLTVRETITHAFECTTATKYSEALTADQVDVALRTLGLSHVGNTVVGDAELRGVSGGQKRRVTLAEKLFGEELSFLFLDEATNGLDAASAFTLGDSAAKVARGFGISVMANLLQPSMELYHTFDNVLVFTRGGRVAFFGPRTKALSYFASLGLKKPENLPEPEFLQQVTSMPEKFASGPSSETYDEDFFTGRYRLSDACGEVKATVAAIKTDWTQVVARNESKMAGLFSEMRRNDVSIASSDSLEVSEFARSFPDSVVLCAKRQIKLITRDPGTPQRMVNAVLFGLIIGSLFYQLSNSGDFVKIRGGAVFTTLFLALVCAILVPFPAFYADRLPYFSQRERNFFSSTAYYLGLWGTHGIVSIAENFIIATIIFFMVGLNGSYGIFLAIMLLQGLCGLAIARMFCYGMPNMHIAETVMPALVTLFAMTSGYSPQYHTVGWWWRWISWINPMAYGYEAAMLSQYGDSMVEMAPGQKVLGSAALRQIFGLPRVSFESAPSFMDSPSKMMGFDLVMMVILFLFYDVIGLLLLDVCIKWYGPTSRRHVYEVADKKHVRIMAGSSDDVKNKNSFDNEPPQATQAETAATLQTSSVVDMPSEMRREPALLTVSTLFYEVDVPKQKQAAAKVEAPAPKKEESVKDATLPEADVQTNLTYGQTMAGSIRAMQARMVGCEVPEPIPDTVGPEDTPVIAMPELPPVGDGRLRLLSGVTCVFRPGTMTALMGESGAGKTTLMDVIAGYKTGGHITGEIRINGVAKDTSTWQRLAGYCEQSDIHLPNLTVRESLRFAAACRLPATLSARQREEHVARVIGLLELTHFADTIVGHEKENEGLPKHARKRLTIGVELSANPTILFLDEPTSGLDALSAAIVMGAVRRVANESKVTVVCTIHQPSRAIFESFDALLLLKREGMCVYHGPIGSASRDVLGYVEDINPEFKMPEGGNPADHVMDIFCGSRGGDNNYPALFASSQLAAEAREQAGRVADPETAAQMARPAPAAGFMQQFVLVLKRQLVSFYRTPQYMGARLWWTVGAAVLVATVFLNLPLTGQGAVDRMGALFFALNIATTPMLAAMIPLIEERAVFYREILTGTYSHYAYGLAMIVAELPFNLLCALAWYVIYYWSVGLQNTAHAALTNLLVLIFTYWLLPSIGQLIAFASPNMGAANGVGTLLLTLGVLTMGFLLPYTAFPAWWKWCYWINPFRYLLQAFISNEFHGLTFSIVDPVTGFGANVSGDQLLTLLSWNYDDMWWYCVVVLVLFLVFVEGVKLLVVRHVCWLKR